MRTIGASRPLLALESLWPGNALLALRSRLAILAVNASRASKPRLALRSGGACLAGWPLRPRRARRQQGDQRIDIKKLLDRDEGQITLRPAS